MVTAFREISRSNLEITCTEVQNLISGYVFTTSTHKPKISKEGQVYIYLKMKFIKQPTFLVFFSVTGRRYKYYDTLGLKAKERKQA